MIPAGGMIVFAIGIDLSKAIQDGFASESRTIDWPDKPKCGWVCACRASSSGQQPGNCPADEFAFGTAADHTYRAARAEAERIASRKLGKQAKHTQCKCIDNKGNRRN